MKKTKRMTLIELASIVLDRIEQGDDFIVSELVNDSHFSILPLPPALSVKEDVMPHVCDFLKAGADKEAVAFYFAYLISDGIKDLDSMYTVYSVKGKTNLNADVKISISDRKLVSKIEDKYMDAALVYKSQRLKAEKEEKPKETYDLSKFLKDSEEEL